MSGNDDEDLFSTGMKTRRAVLGDDYVDASMKAADRDPLPMAMQEFVVKYCWGDVWNRPGLDRRTRSFLNLAMLTALGRPHELKLHIRGALNNGLTRDEIGEAFLQAAVYCGVPAALDSFRVARDVYREFDEA
jgi:4-carboxymuconolactone decarboxylase